MKKNKIIILPLFVLAFMLFKMSSVSAHVSVKPAGANVATHTDFSITVPNEKEIPTTTVRLVVPDALQSVTPYVKAGWKIDVKKDGDKVKEITWTGGLIPAGQKDLFNFTTQVPVSETTLIWKTYQTYEDGTTVSWDADPKIKDDDSEKAVSGPWSETKIINDLAKPGEKTSPFSKITWPMVISIAALALALIALMKNGQK